MRKLDPYQPIFSLQDVSECTCITRRTLERYLVLDNLELQSDDGRRAFTAIRMVEIYVTHKLSTLLKVPVSSGLQIAKQLISEMPAGMLSKDAADAEPASTWCLSASYRGHVLKGGEIELVVPVQLFAREIFSRATSMLWIG